MSVARKDTTRQEMKSHNASLPDIRDELLAIIRHELPNIIKTAITEEFRSIHNRLTVMEQSVKLISDQYDDTQEKFFEQIEQCNKLKKQNDVLSEKNKELELRMTHLEEEHHKSEQWDRIQNVEILGIPERKSESLTDVVLRLANHVGIKLEPKNIEFAHRVQAKRPVAGRSRAIVVRLRDRAHKDALLVAVRRCRGVTTKDVGMDGEPRKIFVNEHLTRKYKHLFNCTKTKAKEANYKFIWTKNCRIYVRKREDAPFICISKDSDLNTIK